MSGCQTCGGFGMHHDPVTHPDEIARQLQRTREYIRARYGDGQIPQSYDEGGVSFADRKAAPEEESA